MGGYRLAFAVGTAVIGVALTAAVAASRRPNRGVSDDPVDTELVAVAEAA